MHTLETIAEAMIVRGRRSLVAERNHIGYTRHMSIRSFRHKGLERFFESGAKRGIQTEYADRLRLILGRLHVATDARDMNLPGLALHPLEGPQRGRWAVRVSGSWRVTFELIGKDAELVDYEDHH